ncbi:P protein-like [Scaptodrosophila lebanonensis]|uniref:P protein-like n=1 Tax=Drosophila lebanonensis TaxID=7225 RepID=A0A6J2U0Z6_DROLE|nr:P protein-like [Scaptodrosophila lebanonensis]
MKSSNPALLERFDRSTLKPGSNQHRNSQELERQGDKQLTARRAMDDSPEDGKERSHWRLAYNIAKICLLLLVWIYFTVNLIIRPPEELQSTLLSLAPNVQMEWSPKETESQRVAISLLGHINEDLTLTTRKRSEAGDAPRIVVFINRVDKDSRKVISKTDDWLVILKPRPAGDLKKVKSHFDVSEDEETLKSSELVVDLRLLQSPDTRAVEISFNSHPVDTQKGTIYGAILLVGMYVLIIWEVTDRTFAALLASSTGVAILTMMGARPTLEEIVAWIDIETMMLLFGMMILVAVLSETGIFDYLAVFAYRMAKGHAWPLIFFLCMFTGTLSAFLDNVTMMLLMTPVTIRLCEVMLLRTNMVLICVVIYSNIGGTMTPVGDPPNVIIATNEYVQRANIDFVNFTLHMFWGVAGSMGMVFVFLYFTLRKRVYMTEERALRQSIRTLEKHANKLQPQTKNEEHLKEDILIRVDEMKNKYKQRKGTTTGAFTLHPVSNYEETLADLQSKYKIRNKPLLVKSVIALIFAMALFFLHSLPFMKGVSLAWAAVLAALLLLVLANLEDMQVVLAQVEWSTLLFFAALFVLMEALAELGLIDWVGDQAIAVIMSVKKKHQLAVGILIILWVSGMTSAFVDNIPITTMMLKLVIKLAKNEELNLPLSPLIWALAYGACFGGNGTLIGASANVVTAGMANQHGYKITFLAFFLIGFPVMLITIIIASIYLLIAHTVFTWHSDWITNT